MRRITNHLRLWWPWGRRAEGRRRAKRQQIAYIEQAPETQEELRALMEAHPGGIVFGSDEHDVLGLDPAEIRRREKEVEAGNYVLASDFFNGLRASIRQRG